MRAYVTGGTGFVGSNIVKVFTERHGATVHCPVHRSFPLTPMASPPSVWTFLTTGPFRPASTSLPPT